MYNPQLETFLRVADAGSFNRAAAEAFITPTAVIKQINLLEGALGVKLFLRTHRGLTLTKAGVSFYHDTKYIIQYCRDSVTRAQNAMQEDSQVIRIGTSPMTPAQILVELWPKIQSLCPEVKFRLVPFENTPENAREILKNLGRNIDVVAGIFDETMLRLRQCAGFVLSHQPLCCAVSVHHPLAGKNLLMPQDLYGEKLMLMRREWSSSMDRLRDGLRQDHPQIQMIDFDFYSIEIFNRCGNGDGILAAVAAWENVHPLLKVIPVAWDYTIPYGLLHSPTPSHTVQKFLAALQTALKS